MTALLLLALPLAGGRPADAAPDDFKARLAEHKRLTKDPSFFNRMMAQAALARTKDPRALAALVKGYGKLPQPRDQSQYLVASFAARSFGEPQFVPDLVKWRNKFARPEHAWLWFQTCVVQAQHGGAGEVAQVVLGKKHPFLRAAALEALAALRAPEALPVLVALLGSLPKAPGPRAALIHAVCSVVHADEHKAGTGGHYALCRRLIDLLDDPLTPDVSKVVIARQLQRSFDVPYAFTQSAPWRQVLGSAESLMEIPALTGPQVPVVAFGPLETRGKRICYLLDLSADAARELLPWEEKKLTGKEPDPEADARLRIIGMRELVRASIERLSPDQSFAVVYHRHHDTHLLPGCEGMLPATPKQVETALAALTRLTPSGASDLHSGLMAAFATAGDGPVKGAEYVSPDALLEGCDTLFVLGQSGPVRDAWVPAGDAPGEVAREVGAGREILGVYSDPEYLVDEVRRWNLFRKAVVHGIAIGNANEREFEDMFRRYRGWATAKKTEARTEDEEVADEYFDAVRREYDEYLRRPSLFMRMRGRGRLARTRDERALEILAVSYGRPEAPTLRVPHLVASLCCDHFAKPEHLARFHQWRMRRAKARDAWLWYRSLRLELEHGDPGKVHALVREAPDLYLRLAAARAVASMRKPDCVPMAAALLADLPEPGLGRAATLEAVAALLQARGHMRSAPDFAAPAEALILQLEDKGLLLRTRLVIARHLAKIFKTDLRAGLGVDFWLRELRGAQHAGDPPPEPVDVYAPFEFIGIPSAGARVCYIVDASDSMLEPISGEDRKRLSRVVTGAGKEAEKKDPLPWDRIKNRFDVAREYLKLSLRKLSKDKAFTVVLFGTDARRLDSTPSLVPATSGTVAAAIQELDAIAPGKPIADRPHGTLRGFTNMHGGFELAFRLTSGELAGNDPYVEPSMLTEGIDTIYLLSDGDPSTDDYRAVDRPDAGDAQADPETRKSQSKVPDVVFHGPYVEFDGYLIDDVRRMNLFRNAAIHCIGIGEADMLLLKELASTGLGETRNLGKE